MELEDIYLESTMYAKEHLDIEECIKKQHDIIAASQRNLMKLELLTHGSHHGDIVKQYNENISSATEQFLKDVKYLRLENRPPKLGRVSQAYF